MQNTKLHQWEIKVKFSYVIERVNNYKDVLGNITGNDLGIRENDW
jgi:hypothetical protein